MPSANLYDAVAPARIPTANEPDAQSQLADEQFRLFKAAYDAGHEAWIRHAIRCDAFYRGDQWEAAVKAKLQNEGRPALTINLILSTLNVVLGEQATSRMTISYKNRKDGGSDAAFAMTKLSQAILSENLYTWVESQVYADGLIQDRGYFDVRMDWSESLEGRVKIKALDPANVIPDPGAKSWDPEEWKEFWYTDWLSLDDIAGTYGEEWVEKLRSVAQVGEQYGRDSIRFTENTFGEDNGLKGTAHKSDDSERIIRSVRVVERQYRCMVRVYNLIDSASGKKRQLPPGTTRSEAESIAKKYGMMIFPQTVSRIRWRVTCDRFVLHDEYSPYKSFTLVPYFPYFRRGKPFGMVTNLLSPQEQLNKLSSQELHIVNSTANSGWVVETGTLHGMTTDELSQQGSKSGLVVEVNPGRMKGLEKIQPNSVPTGIDRISAKAKQSIQDISGVNGAMLASDGPEVSGVALEKKAQMGAVQVAVPRDSLARTQWMVARKLLELMQTFMSHEQIIKYTEDMATGQPDDQEVVANQVQEDGSVKADFTAGEYDFAITSMPSRDTFNDVQFAEALSLRGAGVNIPSYRVVQYSNLQHKDQIAEEIKQLEGLGEKTPEQQEMEAKMQALQERAANADIARDEALAVKDQALAALAQAKTQEIPARIQLDAAEFQQSVQSEREGHVVRLDLANINAASKDRTNRLGAQSKLQMTTINALNKLDNTALTHKLSPTKNEGTNDD